MEHIKVFVFTIDFATGLDMSLALHEGGHLRPVNWGDGLPATVSGNLDSGHFWVGIADGGAARKVCHQFTGTVPTKIHPVVAGKVIPR